MTAPTDREAAAKLGRRLRSLRRAQHLTQNMLADKVPCSVASISYYERGRYYPRRSRVFRLAHVLQCSVEWLKGDPEAVNTLPLSEESDAVRLGIAAHEAAKRDRMHCSGHVTCGFRFNQCQLWAYHEGPCDDNPPPEASSFAP